MSDEARQETVMKRYAQKERVLKAGNNSEDVWEERRWLVGRVWEPLEQGNSKAEEEVPEGPKEPGRGAAKGLYTP